MSADNPQDSVGTTGQDKAGMPTSTTMSSMVSENARPQSAISIIALTIGIVALAASGYVWYSISVTGRLQLMEALTRAEVIAEEFDKIRSSQQAAFVDRTAIYRQLEDDRQALEGELRSLDARVEAVLSQLEKQQNDAVRELQNDVTTLTRSMERTREEIGRVADDWVLEEMAQLLVFATERLQLTGDVALALRALQLAQTRLGEIADPTLVALRRQLARDIATLAAVSLPDIGGIVLQLSTLIEIAHGLPVTGDHDEPKLGSAAVVDQDAQAPDATFTGLGRKLIEDLGALVKIRNVEETQLPRLEPEQRRLIFENLRLPLSTAQLALLRNLPGVYRDSLMQAQAVLDEHFDRRAADVISFHSAIDELVAVEVVYKWPDISGSLDILREKLRDLSKEE